MRRTDNCPRCENDISPNATECPRCGIRVRIVDGAESIFTGEPIQSW